MMNGTDTQSRYYVLRWLSPFSLHLVSKFLCFKRKGWEVRFKGDPQPSIVPDQSAKTIYLVLLRFSYSVCLVATVRDAREASNIQYQIVNWIGRVRLFAVQNWTIFSLKYVNCVL
jgi:hypothetical protein